ncbi:MAG: zinc ribbon domain-containing protein, partial [Clostridia bacterium]|nr:zinc ribbon domain-containing protein [Clostridia bacterium]
LKGQYSGNGCFASRIVCGDCGHFYGSKVWHSNDPYRKVIWRCNHKYNGQQKCTSPHVSQETLECAFEEVMRRMIAQREHVIAACRLAVKEVLDADDLNREREALEEKLLLLNERIRRLVNDNARTELDQEEYRREYDTLSAQYKQATDRIGEIDEELSSRESRKKRIELFLRMFEKQEADVAFDPGTFVAMVEQVVIRQRIEGKSIELAFELRSGQVYRIKL